MFFAVAAAVFFLLVAFKMFQILNIFSYSTPTTSMGFWERWQTLVAGILALLGAWLTVIAIRRQIGQAEQLENQRNIREGRAARAVLPLALSELTQYSTDCIKIFEYCYLANLNTTHQIPEGLSTPRIPDGILEQLQACARFGDDEVASKIWELLAWLQIQHSRLVTLIRRIDGHNKKTMVLGVEVLNSTLDSVELIVKCENLFPYSRGTLPTNNQSFQNRLESAFFTSAGVVVVDYPVLLGLIKMRLPWMLPANLLINERN